MEKIEHLDHQDSADLTTADAVSKTMESATGVSKLYLVKVLIKLIPILIHLRRDRREWVKREGRNIDTKKYIKHAERTLATFIALGPSYIKLGQWLSTRTDVLPQPYLEVLAKLQDDVPPSDFSLVQETIEKEIGKIDRVFDKFDKKAKSGASLGQVYLAQLQGTGYYHQSITTSYRENSLKRYSGSKVNPSFSNPLHRSQFEVFC